MIIVVEFQLYAKTVIVLAVFHVDMWTSTKGGLISYGPIWTRGMGSKIIFSCGCHKWIS